MSTAPQSCATVDPDGKAIAKAQAAALRDAADDMAQEALRAAKSTDPEQANAYVNAAHRLRARAAALEATTTGGGTP